MKFLDEHSARQAIRSLVRDADRACLAVAFWGRDAVRNLGLDRPGLDLTVVCNLDSGACNPAEIRRLIDAAGTGRVFSDPRLHAKVYWTPAGAVVGSSNASSNGLAVEEQDSGWAEANMLIRDPAILAEMGNWFEARHASAYVIDEKALTRAEAVWKARKAGAPVGKRLTSDLFAAFRQTTAHPIWRKVRVAIWTEQVDAEGQKQHDAAVIDNSTLASWECFQGWNKELKAGQWVLDVDLTGQRASFSGFCRVPTPKYQTPDLTFVQKTDAISLPGFGVMQLSRADQKALEAIAPTLLAQSRSTEGALVSLAKTVTAIDKHAITVANKRREAEFESVLLEAYDEAKELGYQPNRFRELVSQLGGVGAAKRLLRNSEKPPSGLTRLVLEKRTDLSIEDAALRPEWRQLFNSAELDVARRRLGR